MLARLFGEAQAVTEARAKEVLPPWQPTSQGHPFSCINTHEPAQLTGLLLPQKDTFQLPELGISTGGTAVPCLRSAQLTPEPRTSRAASNAWTKQAPLQSPQPQLSKTDSNFITAVPPLQISWSLRFFASFNCAKAWRIGLSQQTGKIIDRKG